MKFITFVRKPFTVEAVEITNDNIAEIAPLVGELDHEADGTPFIQVNPKKVPNVHRVLAGYWMTKMGKNIRCYKRSIFEDQFIKTNDEIDRWVEYLNDPKQNAVDVDSIEVSGIANPVNTDVLRIEGDPVPEDVV